MKKILLIAIGLLLLTGIFYWLSRPPHHTEQEWKALSIKTAERRLAEFIKQEQLNRADFTGPYCKRSGYDPRGKTYSTCYKSAAHHFCYHQAGHLAHGYLISEVNCDTPICQWLKSQP